LAAWIGRGSLTGMSTLTIELSDDLAARLEAVSAALKVRPAQWATEAVARALPRNLSGLAVGKGWPAGYFEKYAGCLAGDDWEPPTDPPPERTPEW
jgi:hypothetical protein